MFWVWLPSVVVVVAAAAAVAASFAVSWVVDYLPGCLGEQQVDVAVVDFLVLQFVEHQVDPEFDDVED